MTLSDKELFYKSYGFLAETKDSSAIDSPRQALTKIHQLTGTALKEFISDFKNGLDSAAFTIKTTPKIDGHPFRVAWIDGEVYIETSYSGLMGAEELKIHKLPAHERRFFDYVSKQNSKPLFNEISKYGLTGVKILGELLANGESFADGDKITYVGTTYDATKLGKYGSVVIIDIKGATLQELKELPADVATKIKTFLASKFSNADVSYFDINQFAQKIPISLSDLPKELANKLNSVDVSSIKGKEAEQIKMEINDALTNIFKSKFKNPSIMDPNDKSLEGVAFELNGKLYGVHYQSWKDIRTSYYADIDEIKEYVHRFLARMVGVKETTTLGSIVTEIRNNINKYQNIWKNSYKEFLRKRKELTDKLLNDTELPKFVRSVGQDRARALLQKFKDEDITSDINSLLNIIMPIKNMDGKTICIIPGSFRPPHKGHFKMIQHYSELADIVYVVISGQATVSSRRPDKFGRTMPNYIAGQILKIYCDAYGLTNIKIQPVMKLMQWIGWKLRSTENAKILFGVSEKDDASRFAGFTSDRFKKQNPTLEILPIDDNISSAETLDGENISATEVRQHIDDKEFIRKIVPDKLSDEEFEKVFELMNPPSGQYPSMVDKSAADQLFAPESKQQTLTEGGNAVSNVVRINQENVAATLDNIKNTLLKRLGIDPKYTTVLGSTGKRLPGHSSGDIDLMIDKKKVGGGDFKTFSKKITDVLDTIKGAEYKAMAANGIVSVRWPISNTDGKQPNEFVQLDLMLADNYEFMKFAQSSPQEVEGEPYYKMTIRNAIFSAIARVMDTTINKTGVVTILGPEERAVDIVRNSYSITDGLNRIHKVRKQKTDGTYNKTWTEVTKKNISLDPQTIINKLFGPGYTPKDVETSLGTWRAAIKSPVFKDKNKYKMFLKTLKDEMDRKMPYQHFELPKEIEDELNTVDTDSHLLDESGGAFEDLSRINQENVQATIDAFKEKFCKFAKVSGEAIQPIGSTGKKLPGHSSGDIDLGIDTSILAKAGNKVDTTDEWFEFCKKFGEYAKIECRTLPRRGLSSVKWPIENKDGKQPNEFVQVDLVPHKNIEMVKWGMYQTPEEKGKETDKSAIRALLLQAIAKAGMLEVLETGDVKNEGSNVPVKVIRYMYEQNNGLWKIWKERTKKSDGTYNKTWKETKREKISEDPQEIINIFFGDNSYKPDQLLSVKEVWDAFKKSKYWKDAKLRKAVEQDFNDKIESFNFEAPKYFNFNESIEEVEQDSNDRVAVIVTDGEQVIVGQTPQRMKFSPEGNCDLPKGHAHVGEDLEDAAKREVYEEIGLRLYSVTPITSKLKYLKGTTLTFFVAYLDTLPPAKSLQCKSFYEYNGKQYPEIAKYHLVPLEDLETYLYKGLAKLIIDNDIKEKAMNTDVKMITEDFGEQIMTIQEFCNAWNLSKEQGAIIMDVLDVYDWNEITFNESELIRAMDIAKNDPDSGWYINFDESKKINLTKLPNMVVESILAEEKHKHNKK